MLALSAVEEMHDAAPYPDDGALFEVWLQRPVATPLVELDGLQPNDELVELKVLGRRSALRPGTRRTNVMR